MQPANPLEAFHLGGVVHHQLFRLANRFFEILLARDERLQQIVVARQHETTLTSFHIHHGFAQVPGMRDHLMGVRNSGSRLHERTAAVVHGRGHRDENC